MIFYFGYANMDYFMILTHHLIRSSTEDSRTATTVYVGPRLNTDTTNCCQVHKQKCINLFVATVWQLFWQSHGKECHTHSSI